MVTVDLMRASISEKMLQKLEYFDRFEKNEKFLIEFAGVNGKIIVGMNFPLAADDQNHLNMFGEESQDLPDMYPNKSLLKEDLENLNDTKEDLVNELTQPGHEHTLDKFMLSFLNKDVKPKRKKKVQSVTPLLYIPNEDKPSIVAIDPTMFDKICGTKKSRKKSTSNRKNVSSNRKNSKQNAKSVLQETVSLDSNVTHEGNDCSKDMPVDCSVCHLKFENHTRLTLHMRVHRRCINTGMRRCKRTVMPQKNSNFNIEMMQGNDNSCSSVLSTSGNEPVDNRNGHFSNTPCNIITEKPHSLKRPVVHHDSVNLKFTMSDYVKYQLATNIHADSSNCVSYIQTGGGGLSSNSHNAFLSQIPSKISSNSKIQTTQTFDTQNSVLVSTNEMLLQNDTGFFSGDCGNGDSASENLKSSTHDVEISCDKRLNNHMTGSCIMTEKRETNHNNLTCLENLNLNTIKTIQNSIPIINHDEIHSEEVTKNSSIQRKSSDALEICHNIYDFISVESHGTGNTCNKNVKTPCGNPSENHANILTVVADVHCSAAGESSELNDKEESVCKSGVKNKSTILSPSPKNTKFLSQSETTIENPNLSEKIRQNRKELENSALLVLTKLLTQKRNSASPYKERKSLGHKNDNKAIKPCTRNSPCKNVKTKKDKSCRDENAFSDKCHGNENFKSAQPGPYHVLLCSPCMGDNSQAEKCENNRHGKLQNGVGLPQQISSRIDNSSVENAVAHGHNDMHDLEGEDACQKQKSNRGDNSLSSNTCQITGFHIEPCPSPCTRMISNRGDNSSNSNTCKITGSNIEPCPSPCTRMIHFVKQIEHFCNNRTMLLQNGNKTNMGIPQKDNMVVTRDDDSFQETDTRSLPLYLDDLEFHYNNNTTKYCGIPLGCHEMTPMGDYSNSKSKGDNKSIDENSFCSRTSCYSLNMKVYHEWKKQQFRNLEKDDLITSDQVKNRSETQGTSSIDDNLNNAGLHGNTISNHRDKTLNSSCSDIEVVYVENNGHEFSDDGNVSAKTDNDKLPYHSETDIFYDESEDQSPKNVNSKLENFMKYRTLKNVLDEDSYLQLDNTMANLDDTVYSYFGQDDATTSLQIQGSLLQKDYVKQSGPKDLNSLCNLQTIKIYDSAETAINGIQTGNCVRGGNQDTPTLVRNLFHKFPSSREACDHENVYGLIMKSSNEKTTYTSSDNDSIASEESMEHNESHVDLYEMEEILKTDKCSRICTYNENMKRKRYFKIQSREKRRKDKLSKKGVKPLQIKKSKSRGICDKTIRKEDRFLKANKRQSISHEKKIQQEEAGGEVTQVMDEKKDRKRKSKQTDSECSPHKIRKDKRTDNKLKTKSSQKCKNNDLQTREIRKRGDNLEKQQCDSLVKNKIDDKFNKKKKSVRSPKISKNKPNRKSETESSRKAVDKVRNDTNNETFNRKTNSKKTTGYEGTRKSPRKHQSPQQYCNNQKLSNNTGIKSRSPRKCQNYVKSKITSEKHCNTEIESLNKHSSGDHSVRKSPRKNPCKNKCTLSCCSESVVENSKCGNGTMSEVNGQEKGVTEEDCLDRVNSKKDFPKKEAKNSCQETTTNDSKVDLQSRNKTKDKKSPIQLRKSPSNKAGAKISQRQKTVAKKSQSNKSEGKKCSLNSLSDKSKLKKSPLNKTVAKKSPLNKIVPKKSPLNKAEKKKSLSNKGVAKKNDERKKERNSKKGIKNVDDEQNNEVRLQVKMFGSAFRRQRKQTKKEMENNNHKKTSKINSGKSDNHERRTDDSATSESKTCRNIISAGKSSGVNNSIYQTNEKLHYKTPEKIDTVGDLSSSNNDSEINKKKHTTPKKRWQALFQNELINSQRDLDYSEHFSKERNIDDQANFSILGKSLALIEKDSPSPYLSDIDIVKTPEMFHCVIPQNGIVTSPKISNSSQQDERDENDRVTSPKISNSSRQDERDENEIPFTDKVKFNSNDCLSCARFIQYSRIRNSSRTLPISEQL